MKTKRRSLSFWMLLYISGTMSTLAVQSTAPDPESQAAKDQRLEWFRHDKFGLFIHWGLYSIPAGYWKGERFHAHGLRRRV